MSEHPPVYNSVPTSETNNEAAPPSYFNIMGQLREAKNNSTGPVDIVKSTLGVLCGSAIFGCCLLVYSALPVAQFAVGITKQDECTIQPWIPLWLVVSGAVGVAYAFLKCLHGLIDYINKRKDPNSVSKPALLLNCVMQLIGMVQLTWFIIGNYFVYSINSDVQYDPLVDPSAYCDKLVYLFAFWSITATWILIGLTCCCICGILCFGLGLASCFAASSG